MGSVPQEPVILIVSHVVPHPPAAGNEIRILKMMEWLRSTGFSVVLLLNHDPLPPERLAALESVVNSVHFIGDDYGELTAPARSCSCSDLAEKLALALPDSGLYRACFGMSREKKTRSNDVKRYLASERLRQVTGHLAEHYRPAAVMAEYIFAAPCLDAIPDGIFKIIDTHDMFSRKKEQVLAFGVDDPLPCTPGEERGYLLKSDLVIAIQSNEARMFRGLVMEREVVTVGIDFDVVPEIDNKSVVPGTVLVVGSDNPLNVHGLREFYLNAWPAVRAGHPEAVLRVVGKLAKHLDTGDERVQLAGWVPDLDEEYRRAAVVINPTVAGTGLKIKSVEALCHAKALIGTPNSVEGIEYCGEAPYRVCEDWCEFGRTVLALLHSGTKRAALQQRAWDFACENFSTEKVYAPLRRKLQGLLAH